MPKSTRIKTLLALLISMGFLLVSCSEDKKDDDTDDGNTPERGSLLIKFHHYVGNEPFSLKDKTYKNANDEEYDPSLFRYYVSNLRLGGASDFTEPESYHLISQSQNQITKEEILDTEIKIDDVTAGTYSTLDFGIGVDAARNTEGAQVGALDPANGMLWNWNIGYIFFKLEGSQVPSDLGKITYHIGGDGAYRTSQLNLSDLVVEGGKETVLNVKVDLAKAFNGSSKISFKEFSSTMSPGDKANSMADNYKDMFSVLATE